ncbi:L-lactate permease [Priestia abyssalis]|uniref:L-lactate permease n=1 Tax=Priestia abyssalis TaxID=1221450 RepID=UPI0011176CCC
MVFSDSCCHSGSIFFLGLTVFKMKAYVAAGSIVIISMIITIMFYKMPVNMVIGAAGYGAVYAIWPILLMYFHFYLLL